MAIDLDKIKSRLSSLSQSNNRTNYQWKPQPGKQQVRIVPYKHQPDNPFIELFFHYGINNRTYLSPVSFGRPDPICEFAEKLKRSGDKDDYRMGRSLMPKMRTFVPVIVRGEEAEGVKFWGFGKEVYQELLGVIADPDYGDITDPENGRDITIEFLSAEEAGRSFPKTNIRVKPNTSPISENKNVLESVSNSQAEITEIYQELGYDELKEALEKWVSGETEEAPPAESETVASVTKVESSEAQVKQPASATSEKSGLNVAATEDVEAAFEELFKS
tara:strand:+ start:73742 stop:74566 length:825 start_codon:yes stop_codon:yes gene_type:complete